jgi:hypothetical protein
VGFFFPRPSAIDRTGKTVAIYRLTLCPIVSLRRSRFRNRFLQEFCYIIQHQIYKKNIAKITIVFCPFLSGKKGTERKPDKIATHGRWPPARAIDMAHSSPSISAFNLWKILSIVFISLDRNARNCANTRPPFWPLLACDFVVRKLLIMIIEMFFMAQIYKSKYL